MEGVCVDASLSRPLSENYWAADFCDDDAEGYNHTDINGEWPPMNDTVGVFGFFAGAKCSDIYIEMLVIPDGYEPTTHAVVNGCYAEFGLRPVDE